MFEFHQVTNEEILQIASKKIEDLYNLFNKGIYVYLNTDEEKNTLDNLLWTRRKKSFLPHATDQDTNLEDQPILLTNRANIMPFTPLAQVFINTFFSETAKSNVIIIFDENCAIKDELRKYYMHLQDNKMQVQFFKHNLAMHST